MILGRLPDIIKQYWALMRERQWATWELLTVAAVAAVLLLLLMIALRRLKEANERRKTARMIVGQPGLTDNQRVQLLQHEIIKRDNAEARIEREISELTTANQQLQVKITELTSANQQLHVKVAKLTSANEQFEVKVSKLTGANEQLRQEVAAGRETRECSEREIAALTAANRQFQAKVTELTNANEKLEHQVGQTRESSEQKVAELTAVSEQLQQEVTARKKTLESSEEKNATLTVTNEQLRDELAEYMKAGGKEIPDRHGKRVPPDESIGLMSEISVKAKSPAQQLRELADEIVDSNSRKSVSDSPDARREAIQEACDYLNADNSAMAVEALKKFINAVEANRGSNGNILHKEEAEDWIGAAREVIYLLTAG